MNSYRRIDLETWPRRELFAFYQSFASPCFNITVSVEAEPIFRYAKTTGNSFFLLCLYAILRAGNRVPQVRQRILAGAPVEYEHIAAMTPIMTGEEMFRQIRCEYHDTYAAFREEAVPKVEEAKNGKPAPLAMASEDFICASCSPWLHFDSLTQADLDFQQTVPILAWGKLENGKIPISVKFNHCFLDALYVARFFDEIKTGFTRPETLLHNA